MKKVVSKVGQVAGSVKGGMVSRSKKIGAFLATAMAITMATAPGMALAAGGAGSDLGTAASTQLDGAQTIILGLLVTLVGIVFLFVIYSLIKKAK
jgi:putative effector of murein hydrolase